MAFGSNKPKTIRIEALKGFFLDRENREPGEVVETLDVITARNLISRGRAEETRKPVGKPKPAAKTEASKGADGKDKAADTKKAA